MEQQKTKDNIHSLSGEEGAIYKVREIGQFRRAKMHASYLIEDIEGKNALTPALRGPLEACLVLQTTSTKVLAPYLHRSPATIRAEFQQILTILGDKSSHSALRTTKNNDFLSPQVSDK